MSHDKLLRGLSAFPITPQLADGTIRIEELNDLVTRLVSADVDSIGLLGSTGTYAYLNRDQRRVAIETAAAAIASTSSTARCPKLLVGIGHIRTDEAVQLAADALAAGADAGLLSPVSYTPLTDEEVFHHFATIAAAVPDLPLVIYSNPSTTKFTFSDGLVARLANELPSVVGVKRGVGGKDSDHCGEHAALKAAIGNRASFDFSLGCSGDWHAVEGLLAGGECWYSVLGGIFPERCAAICAASMRGDADEARRLNAELEPLWALMKEHGSLRMAYCILGLTGLCEAKLPLPLLPLCAKEQARVKSALVECGLQPAV
jgi:4-hydroxy-tetrahydrodipicolinate synthase